MSHSCFDVRRRRNRVAAVISLMSSVATIAACGNTAQRAQSGTASPTASTPTSAPTPTPTPVPTIVAGATYSSPAIVQIENLNAARPESGLSSANVVYEYSAEAGIGRFSVIFFSGQVNRVGPLRSARLVSPVLVQQYGGALVYSGSSSYVSNRMNADHTRRFDETSAGRDMFRVSSRFAPHNLYTDGAHVNDLVRRAAQPAVTYTLWARGGTAAGGVPVTGFVAPVSPSERPSYTWHPELGGWIRTEPDTGVFIDADTSQVVVAPTVVVMQVPARINPADIESGCCTAGWEYTLSGSGAAQVFTGGAMYDATWTQPPAGGPPQFTLAGGVPAPMAAGLVWICLVPSGQRAATR
jgi:Protein of unknown function (DUF3048) N-terminal domain/Protein of unknown function (DUF3048) C-terminal domain